MAFSVKQWFDRFGSGGSYDQPTDTGDVPDTPLDAAGQRDQETRLSAYTDSTVAAHTGAATAAHAASAVSFAPTGSVGSTTAQAAIAEVASEAASALTSGLAGKADLSGGHVPLAQLGSGTPASGKYVDGASGAWLSLPAQSGSGTAATTTFTPAGSIAATDVQAAIVEVAAEAQPLDSDLTAIAALTTTSYGRALLALADAAAGRTALGLGTAATQATGAFDASGAAAAAQAASQPLDSDLTAIAALTTTSYGRALLALADAAAGRTALGLGTVAVTALDVDGALAANSDVKVASQKAVKTYVDAHAGGGGVDLGSRLTFPWRSQKPISVNMTDQLFAKQMLAMGTYNVGTGVLTEDTTSWAFDVDAADNNNPVLRSNANAYPQAYAIFLRDVDRNADVDFTVRFKLVPASPPVHPSTGLEFHFRNLGPDNPAKFNSLVKSWNPATPVSQLTKDGAGATIIAQDTSDSDTTSQAVRFVRIRAVKNLLQTKSWIGAVEPDAWGTSRVYNATASRPGGRIGIVWTPVDADRLKISEITVNRLDYASSNFFPNGDMSLFDVSTGLPAWWTMSAANGGIAEVVDVADRFGDVRPALHLVRSTPIGSKVAGATLPLIGHELKNWQLQGGNYVPTRSEIRVPTFGRTREFRCWSMGNCTNTIDSTYGVAMVGKLYDMDFTDLAAADGDVTHYAVGLGPNKQAPNAGTGIWGWTETLERFTPLTHADRLAIIDPTIVFHDVTASGEIWVQDFEMEAVE